MSLDDVDLENLLLDRLAEAKNRARNARKGADVGIEEGDLEL